MTLDVSSTEPVQFGRRLLHDPASRRYATTLTEPIPGKSVRHLLAAPHVDQFYLNGCVGFAGTNALNTLAAVRSRRKYNTWRRGAYTSMILDNSDGIENYHEATRFDPFPGEYPPVDEGSAAIGLMKFWKAIGVIDRYDWTFTWWGFLAELQRQPLLVGTDWYDDMMSTDADGLVTTRGGANPGGHEYLASEIQWDQRLIGFEQSWGEHPPGFGIDGRFWMRWGLAKQLIVKQRGDVCVPRWL